MIRARWKIFRTFFSALADPLTYNARRNVYFWFGVLWGLPIPAFSLLLDAVATGAGWRDVPGLIVRHPYHLFFILHPLFFGIVFGALGTVKGWLERENERLREMTLEQNERLRELSLSVEEKAAERVRLAEGMTARLRRNFEDALKSLAALACADRQGWSAHAQRTAETCVKLARLFERPESERRDIETAARLHEIGLLALPLDAALDPSVRRGDGGKQGYRHPVLAETQLLFIDELAGARRIIRHQLERFDGRGHPDGLKAEEIPFGARLLRVACDYAHATALPPGEERGRRLNALFSDAEVLYDPQILQQLREMDASSSSGAEYSEARLPLPRLREGMTVSRDLRTQRGLLLIPAGTVLDRTHLQRVTQFDLADRVEGGLVWVQMTPEEALEAEGGPSRSEGFDRATS